MSDPSASVRVLLFAAVRDIAGTRQCELQLDAPTQVHEIAQRLVRRFPALAQHLQSVRFAVNGAYARDEDAVNPGDEVAVIPPVAGG